MARSAASSASLFDVTDRHRAEDALRESEARLRTIIESEPNA